MGVNENLGELRRDIDTIVKEVEALARKYGREVEPQSLEPVPLASAGPIKQLHGAAAMLGVSVLFDSSLEHYRGSFQNRAMVLPLLASAANILASGHGMNEREADSHVGRTLVYCAAIGIGVLGTGFHVYNVGKRVGGFRWENFS